MVRSPRDGRTPDDGSKRSRSSPLPLLVVVLAVAILAVTGVVFAPQFAETLDAVTAGSDSPPDPADRSPDRIDAAEPGETVYRTDAERVSSGDVEALVHEAVNERRVERGLEPIERDGTIASVARAHSADMYERDYFAHQNPDGENPGDRFTDVADYCRRYGENIAQTWLGRPVQTGDGDTERYDTAAQLAEGLVEGWMESPPHREAILSSSWDRGGVGVYLADDGRVYATHNFCADR